MKQALGLALWVVLLSALGCGESAAPPPAVPPGPPPEPAIITVKHVLIAFQGAAGPGASRSREEAEKLAKEILARAKAGEDFDGLMKESADRPPGTYTLLNHGVAETASGQYPRAKMVAAFGDVGFKLAVGGVGLSDYDPKTSPYGYHVIKRVQ